MTIWTIRIALLLFTTSLIARSGCDRTKVNHWPRFFWTLATLVYLAHVVFAFAEYHNWSHAAATEHTAEQSERVIGIRFGAGIWFNHLFSLLCISETAWWWINSFHYQTRARWMNIVIFGYLAFIAVNGTIVFASGPIRWVSICVLILTLLLASVVWRNSKQPQPG